MRQDAAAHQEHRGGTGHGQHPHQHGRGAEQALANRRHPAAPGAHQVQPKVIELDDASDGSVDTDGHQQRHARQHGDLRRELRAGHSAQRDGDDLARQDEVGPHRPPDLVALEGDQIDLRIGQRLRQFDTVGLVLGCVVQEPVRQFLEAFETQVVSRHS
jgi:hypothetical protein